MGNPNRTCSGCGEPLAGEATELLCPVCALKCIIEEELEPSFEAESATPTTVSPTSSFGDYELLEEISRGGMGVVYKARQRSLQRLVALKMVLGGPMASASARQRFLAEARAAASLQHPNVIAIHEVGEHGGQPFFSMDYVEGGSLADLLRHGPLSARPAAVYAKTIAEAVQYAHRKGVLHRDLKPSNVLIDASNQPRVTDFGLAKHLTGDLDLTVSGELIGSPNFMSPEQADGRHREVGPASDVYSLGALLYHLITGRPPFQAAVVTDVLRQVAMAEPAAPCLLNPSIPRDLETICLKCLEKEPVRRYPTAQGLADDLARFLEGRPILARPIGLAGRTWRWCRRNPVVSAATGAAVLSLLITFVGVSWQFVRVQAARHLAEMSALSERRQAYISEISAAQAALKANNPARALELLNRHRLQVKSEPWSVKSDLDLRGFEWRYLWQECQNEAEVVGVLPGRIRSLEASSDGKWLAAGSERGTVKVWNLLTGEEVTLLRDKGWKSYANFSPDSRLLLYTDQSTNSWGTILSWNTETRERRVFLTNACPVGIPFFSPDGKLLAYGSVDTVQWGRKVTVVDYTTGAAVGVVEATTGLTDDFHGMEGVLAGDDRSVILSENDPDRRIAFGNFRVGSEPQQRFLAHLEPITAMTMTPDGNILATGAGLTRSGAKSSDNSVKLWEIPSFRLLGELSGHDDWITALRFSPDGRTLVSASADQTIRLWEIPEGNLRWISRRLPYAVARLCFAMDGHSIFTGTSDGRIQRWRLDLLLGGERYFCRLPVGFDSIAVTRFGDRLAGIRNGTICMAEICNPALIRTIAELGTNNQSILFSADGGLLFAGNWTGEVKVWSVARGELLHRLQSIAEPVWQLHEGPRDQPLAILHCDAWAIREGRPCHIGIWRMEGKPAEWKQQKSWIASGYRLSSALSPDGRWLATGDPSAPVQIWNIEGLGVANTASFAAGTLASLAFSPDGHLLAAGTEEGNVAVWLAPGFQARPPLRAHLRAVEALAFSPDGQRLATASEGHEAVKLWDVATWRELITLELPGEVLKKMAFVDENRLVALNSQGDVLIWSVPSLAEINAKKPLLP